MSYTVDAIAPKKKLRKELDRVFTESYPGANAEVTKHFGLGRDVAVGIAESSYYDGDVVVRVSGHNSQGENDHPWHTVNVAQHTG